MASGVSAYTYTVYANALKALKGSTVQATLEKTTIDNQILVIGGVYQNRSIDFRIAHGSSDSTWQYVSNTNNVVLQIHGGMLQYLYAVAPGTKTLKMRTVGIHIGVTGIHGSWWLSEAEYNIFH